MTAVQQAERDYEQGFLTGFADASAQPEPVSRGFTVADVGMSWARGYLAGWVVGLPTDLRNAEEPAPVIEEIA